MGDSRFECFEGSVHEGAHVRHLSTCSMSDVQRELVAGCLEQGQRLVDQFGQSGGGAFGLDEQANLSFLDSPAEVADAVVRGFRPL
jgi:hypothetical protein